MPASRPADRPQTAGPERTGRGCSGTAIVLGMLGLAVTLAAFAIWFQRGQTRRCLAFYGPAVAERIRTAPRVELWQPFAAGIIDGSADAAGGAEAATRTDVSSARGIVHLRHGLVEDANFAWDEPPPTDAAGPAFALAFFADPAAAKPVTILAVRLADGGGSLEVPGRPGRVTLGRLARALHIWLADVAPPAGQPVAR